jgi:hypothetical protein
MITIEAETPAEADLMLSLMTSCNPATRWRILIQGEPVAWSWHPAPEKT